MVSYANLLLYLLVAVTATCWGGRCVGPGIEQDSWREYEFFVHAGIRFLSSVLYCNF